VTLRSGAAIGAGLAPARAARMIRAGERIHVVGAAGAGASAAALLAAWAGAAVDGCDPGGPSQYTPALDATGIEVAPTHAADHVRRTVPPERLAVTKALTAVDPDHPELAAARAAGIPVEPWQQVVADAATGRRLVAVAGTHGKSTSAGWLVHVLAAAGEDPAAFVGALLPASLTGIDVPATARRGRGGVVVVEADEYAGNFDAYRPEVIVLTSAEWDHPDVFRDRAAVLAAFESWIRLAAGAGVPGDGPAVVDGHGAGDARGCGPMPLPVLVANVADAGVAEVASRLSGWPGRIVATAVADGPAAWIAGEAGAFAERFRTAGGPAVPLLGRITDADPDSTVVEIEGLDASTGPTQVRLATAGRHNVANALGVAGAALAVGLGPDAIVVGLAGFASVGRRLERKGAADGVVVYDDYGHHPSAIRATLAAVRQREPGRRVWAVYEPLTYHRTAAMLDAFADVLAGADAVAIADIWAGRDPDTTMTSAAALAEAVAARAPGRPVAAPGSVEATAAWLAGEVRAGDAVLVMGGGRSYRIGELLLERLAGG
jgi:UDP-N-acetylmuramate--alanine ligase